MPDSSSLTKFRRRIKGSYDRTTTYLKTFFYQRRLQLIGIVDRWQVREKATDLLSLVINILVTGTAVWVILRYWGSILSYGLLIALTCYYIEWLIGIIKSPPKQPPAVYWHNATEREL